jgi:pimeloyl-ACP methyl ester carboxylesterase
MSRDIHYQSHDGLRLFADDRGPLECPLTPVLCIPGLTRNSKDFEPVFELLAGVRRVIAMDLRGRGRSQYAADSKTYNVAIELRDVIALLDHLNIQRVALIGTSRGGLIGQVMAVLHASRIAGLLLNDIGAEINTEGYKSILGYLGKPVSYADWQEAGVALAKRASGFSNVTQVQWINVAKRIYKERDGQACTDYDLKLGEHGPTLQDVEAGKLPNLWNMTPALCHLPVAMLRGAGSNILDLATVQRMKREVPELEFTEIPNRGHVPFLDEIESVYAIRKWLEAVDAKEKGQ